MRTSIAINNNLIEEAYKYSANVSSKQELVEIALLEYVNNRKQKSIRDLKGKIEFADGYDYKAMR
ncbi:MAG: type II toxin-antitoxin system VapB family antitoxin [Elusimicrobiota bacterium]|jgi:Arc/MetJ family transcription regulator|nr:type II toxin-antitoxin system VapB family antitoxin [Elusimicrobiota bacterium]